MFFKLKIFIAIALLFANTPSFAQTPNLPFHFSNDMPIYEVKLTNSKSLPRVSFQLTKRATRILPQYILPLTATTKQISQLNSISKIELIHTGKNNCNTGNNCWPKRIEAYDNILKITDWSGNTEYYKDTGKLGLFLWRESRTTFKEIIKKMDRE